MKLVIFDIDGTLCDTVKVDDSTFLSSFKEVLGIDGISIDWASYRTTTDTGLTREIIERHLKREAKAEDIERVKANFIGKLNQIRINQPQFFAEVSGAKSIFDLLSKRSDLLVGIATGAWEESGLIKLGAIDISLEGHAFGNSNFYETREEIVQMTIDQAKKQNQGQEFEKITYVGDGVWDFNATQALGIDFIGMNFHRTDKLKSTSAPIILNDYLDQAGFLNLLELE